MALVYLAYNLHRAVNIFMAKDRDVVVAFGRIAPPTLSSLQSEQVFFPFTS